MKNPNTADYLLSHGIKPSAHRVAVMNFLLNNRTHPTVDTIYAALAPSIRTLSKTTVYNSLKLFVEKEAIQVIEIDDKGTRYDACCDKHGHFKCLACGGVFDVFKMPYLNQDELGLSDFKITDCQIYYKGYCPDCVKKEMHFNSNN